jgi:DNA invertase Pin-like site-specific DNA recombinase
MRVALYARTSAAGQGQDTDHLAHLRAYAARRGWEVLLEHTDPVPGQEGAGRGPRSLRDAVRTRAIQGVLVGALSHFARSLRHLTNLGHLLAENGVALIALEDGLDTTEPGGAIRWRDWLETSLRFDRQLRAEAARLAHQRAAGARWGRPPASINPLELTSLWEGRHGRRPLTQSQLATRLGVSRTTIRKNLQALRSAGKLDDQARTRHLAQRGGHRKGGRPATTLNDTTLKALWTLHLRAAREQGTQPSIAVIATILHVSRSRVRARLQELGLLSEEIPNRRPEGARE